jgi:hypothetical protein
MPIYKVTVDSDTPIIVKADGYEGVSDGGGAKFYEEGEQIAEFSRYYYIHIEEVVNSGG